MQSKPLRSTGVHAYSAYGTLRENLVFAAPACVPRAGRTCAAEETRWNKGLTNLMSKRCLRLIDRSPARRGGYCARKAGRGICLPFVFSRAHHEIAFSAGSFRSKPDRKSVVPGPQAGNNRNRGPGTHPHRTPGSPSSSQRTGVATRYVGEWIEFVYLSRGPHDTQYLSSCLVTSAGNAPCFLWSRSGQ